MKKAMSGFTIVELLIVIVVIAILATVSIVAYRGIQNRANDSAIQSDLANFAKKIQLAAATTGEFPAGGAISAVGGTSGSAIVFPGFTFSPSKSAYRTQEHNLFYCTGTETVSGQNIFRIRARSKSGSTFVYTSNIGMQNIGSVSVGWLEVCDGIDYPRTFTYAFHTLNGWYAWAD